MPEVSRAPSALPSRRCVLLAPALAAVASPRVAGALSVPPPDPWAFSPEVKDIWVGASALLWTARGWRLVRSGQQTIGGMTPHLEPGGLLRPELGDSFERRSAEVAVTTLRRHSRGQRRFDASGRASQPPPTPRVISPESGIAHAEADEQRRLNIWVSLLLQDITEELPERPRQGVRFVSILDSASQQRRLPGGCKERALKSQVTHHAVTSGTIEEQVLRRLDEVVARAVLFRGPAYDYP